MRTLLCVCPLRVESLFPPVLLKSCNQMLLALKVWFSRNSSSCCQASRLGSLMWGSEPSLQWVDFCGISVLQFVSHPPSSYGIWFCYDSIPLTISLRLLLCLCMWGIFFGEFQCLPVNDCSAVSCDSDVLERGSESMSFYSAILNQSPIYCLFIHLYFLIYILLQNIYITSVVGTRYRKGEYLQLRILITESHWRHKYKGHYTNGRKISVSSALLNQNHSLLSKKAAKGE